MDLNEALGQFDIVEANLRRLEKVWEEMSSLIYDQGPILGVRDERRYEALRRAYGAIASKLPTIDGSRLDGYPADSDEVAQHQFQARELSEPEGYIYADQVIYAPSKALDDYRFRFDSARRELVRERMGQLMREVDDLLARLLEWVAENNEPVVDSDWSRLKEVISEIDRLAGDVTPRKGRWSEMSRHLSFGQGFDVHDIANLDWPSVRADIEAGMYSELEPLPVEVDDLTSLVNTKPAGPVSTKLAWSKLDAEDFERLLFNIVAKAEGYENARWLTRTNAPDRGRDISVDRVLPDALSGVARQRVIIQAKHWLTNRFHLWTIQALSTISLWEPPLVNVLIIATSGRFTSDAVAVMEKHNSEGNRPIIEPWPESHLESLLAERPHLVAEFRLRSPHS